VSQAPGKSLAFAVTKVRSAIRTLSSITLVFVVWTSCDPAGGFSAHNLIPMGLANVPTTLVIFQNIHVRTKCGGEWRLYTG
jgi:hypothetical protein